MSWTPGPFSATMSDRQLLTTAAKHYREFTLGRVKERLGMGYDLDGFENVGGKRQLAAYFIHEAWLEHGQWDDNDVYLQPPAYVVCWGCEILGRLDTEAFPYIHHIHNDGPIHRWKHRGYTFSYYQSITNEHFTAKGLHQKYVLLCRWCHNVIHQEEITLCPDTFPFGALAAALTSPDYRVELQKLRKITLTPSPPGTKKTTLS